jgi:hypothetical protein
VVASPNTCPVCGETMSGRSPSAWSHKCRARKSRLARVPLPVEEVREIRKSLNDQAGSPRITCRLADSGAAEVTILDANGTVLWKTP